MKEQDKKQLAVSMPKSRFNELKQSAIYGVKYGLPLGIVAMSSSAYANIPELTIDTAGLMKAFAVIIAAIAVVGMAVLTTALTAKAFKYIRTAF